MKIAKDTVVQLHYSLYDDQGNLIESTLDASGNSESGSEPVAYLQGHQNMIAGFEKAVTGMEPGEQQSFTLEAKDAYGERKEGNEQRVPVKHLQSPDAGKGKTKWRKGMVAWVQTDQGTRQVTISKVGRFMADVDTNHPLAGKTLRFDVDIVAVRAATPEEIDHKHAHGVGGHQH
ncbi:FKBP-type peptidyl-prolyl cis-trans isomerase [Bacterioplanoides pacificum]|uniref:Peptidyl-prolyl cis-trans isomerase n=1 Tax=Bacterioplanoides pacificum TaxID=1171596 RepID=A0ABV7VVX2_9GAMM